MKNIVCILTALFIVLTASAQSRTEFYMKKIPSMPKDSCNVTKAAAESYETMVGGLKKQLDGEIQSLNEQLNSHMEANQGTAEENITKQMSEMYGISEEDLETMKNSKDMSKAEKQALANKMLMQQTNMSMEEVQNLSNMSESGKKAYTEAYATEAMATSQANPQQDARNQNAMNMNQAVQSQQDANNKIQELNSKIASLYSPIANDPERQKMLDRIDTWHDKMMSMSGIVTDSQAKKIDSLSVLITKEQIAYCNKYTPKHRAAVRKHYAILKNSLPDYKNFGDVMAESTKAQTGIEMPPETREIATLEAISSYLDALQAVYKYKLYYPEDN